MLTENEYIKIILGLTSWSVGPCIGRWLVVVRYSALKGTRNEKVSQALSIEME